MPKTIKPKIIEKPTDIVESKNEIQDSGFEMLIAKAMQLPPIKKTEFEKIDCRVDEDHDCHISPKDGCNCQVEDYS